jgi:SAM-dependent methyltransferase
MPSIEDNLALWNDKANWRQEGDEWSIEFGNTDALWSFVVFPRIHRFVPAKRILEIAPGYGRWTQYLHQLCDSLVVVDLSPACIEGCRTRFSNVSNITYHVNDGTSLEMVPDTSIDFAFSFDSLVHAEQDVIRAYIGQLARKLTPDGVAFLHHSNLGAYSKTISVLNWAPQSLYLRRIATRLAGFRTYGRSPSVTAQLFRQICEESGVPCISQELITWVQRQRMIDALSVFARRESVWNRPIQLLSNPSFWPQAKTVRELSRLYSTQVQRGAARQAIAARP